LFDSFFPHSPTSSNFEMSASGSSQQLAATKRSIAARKLCVPLTDISNTETTQVSSKQKQQQQRQQPKRAAGHAPFNSPLPCRHVKLKRQNTALKCVEQAAPTKRMRTDFKTAGGNCITISSSAFCASSAPKSSNVKFFSASACEQYN
jgi:hypothetical protein